MDYVLDKSFIKRTISGLTLFSGWL